MSTVNTATSSPEHKERGTFFFLQVVITIAILVATLFTAWTDPGLLPGNFGDRFTLAEGPEATEEAVADVTATPRGTPLVGIVVGHWDDDSRDPGAICTDIELTEFEVNQTIATLVQANLAEAGLDTVLLKEFDPRLNNFQADALISIHADSCDYINDQATGFKVSSALSNTDTQGTARFVTCLRSRYTQATGLSLHNSITVDMTSYHAFNEIYPNTPAVIIETGFLNLDRRLLTQEPERPARGISDGILCFLNGENPAPLPTATVTPTLAP